jgi:hypothetical protein
MYGVESCSLIRRTMKIVFISLLFDDIQSLAHSLSTHSTTRRGGTVAEARTGSLRVASIACLPVRTVAISSERLTDGL